VLRLLRVPVLAGSGLIVGEEVGGLLGGGGFAGFPVAGQTAEASPAMATSGWAMTLSQSCTLGAGLSLLLWLALLQVECQ
jgi:hypothetical protein